jgi:hypothetical protein
LIQCLGEHRGGCVGAVVVEKTFTQAVAFHVDIEDPDLFDCPGRIGELAKKYGFSDSVHADDVEHYPVVLGFQDLERSTQLGFGSSPDRVGLIGVAA